MSENEKTIGFTSAQLQAMLRRHLSKEYGRVIALALVIVGVAWSAYAIRFWLPDAVSLSEGPDARAAAKAAWGQLGDYIGGMINPIVSSITMLFVAGTLLTQREQLDLSVYELQMTREELRKTAISQEAAAKAQIEAARLTEKQTAYGTLASRIQALHAAITVAEARDQDLRQAAKAHERTEEIRAVGELRAALQRKILVAINELEELEAKFGAKTGAGPVW